MEYKVVEKVSLEDLLNKDEWKPSGGLFWTDKKEKWALAELIKSGIARFEEISIGEDCRILPIIGRELLKKLGYEEEDF